MILPHLQHGGLHGPLLATGEWVDFSTNMNPFGPPPYLEECVLETLRNIQHYPDPHSTDLKEKIGAKYGLKTEHIALGNGSIELLYVLCALKLWKKVHLFQPTFSEYERALNLFQIPIQNHQLNPTTHFSIALKKACDDLKPSEALFLCNPNNPTGTLLPFEDILHLGEHCKKVGAHLVIDESFLDFTLEKTAASLVKSNPSILVFKSLTKIYSIPGLRLGVLYAPEQISRQINQSLPPWNVNSIALDFAKKALEDKTFLQQSQWQIQQLREEFFAKTKELKHFTFYPSSSNFLLVHSKKIPCDLLNQKLQQKKMFVRNCANFKGLDGHYFRIGLKQKEKNQRLLEFLKDIEKR